MARWVVHLSYRLLLKTSMRRTCWTRFLRILNARRVWWFRRSCSNADRVNSFAAKIAFRAFRKCQARTFPMANSSAQSATRLIPSISRIGYCKTSSWTWDSPAQASASKFTLSTNCSHTFSAAYAMLAISVLMTVNRTIEAWAAFNMETQAKVARLQCGSPWYSRDPYLIWVATGTRVQPFK